MTDLRYDFDASANSTYVRAARLIASAELPGLVVDLGAGVGALGDAIEPYGFAHVALDADPANVAAMTERGRRAGELDLLAPDAVDRIVDAVDGLADDSEDADVTVRAIALLDVIEHLPDPDHVMSLLAAVVERFAERSGHRPLLVLSIPNVAHVDLAGKLLLGRWDTTEVGLLDSTHIALFTESRLDALVGAHGFSELTRSDVVFPVTEQQFPTGFPVFGATTLAGYLGALRRRADDASQTYQFVRSYRHDPDRAAETVEMSAGEDPFCSVIVRTQGTRSSLTDTLVSLATQSDADVEVLVMVHSPDVTVVDGVRSLVDAFEPGFAERVRVHQVVGGGRSRPLNRALDVATGVYVAILDDDDVVTSEWVSAFKRAAERCPGRVVRARTVVQWVERADGLLDFEPVSGFESTYPPEFDFVDNVRSNRSPPCCYALPMATVRALNITFDETLRVCEDWKFALDVARYAGVSDDDEVTSVYRRWRTDGGSATAESVETWMTDHERVIDDLDTVPTVFPAGSLRRIHELYRYVERLETELGRRTPSDLPFRFDERPPG